MKKCCVCENHNIEENADVLFINQQGEYKELCPECSKMMEIIENNESPKEVRKAIFYFESFLNKTKDFEVKKFLNNLINEYDNPTSNIENAEISQEMRHSTIWVQGLKAVAWFLFFGIILACLIFGIIIGDALGFLLFIVSFPIAFLCVAGMMIWLDVAGDIREIKNKLK